MTDNTDVPAEAGESGEERHSRIERGYPDTLLITVKSAEEMDRDVLGKFDEAIASTDSTATDEAIRAFEKVSEVRELLTDRRVELLRTIRSEKPESISELADIVDRAYSVVNKDVNTLSSYDIVQSASGPRGAKRPYIPYEEVHVDIPLLEDETPSERRDFLAPDPESTRERETEWLESAEDPRKTAS